MAQVKVGDRVRVVEFKGHDYDDAVFVIAGMRTMPSGYRLIWVSHEDPDYDGYNQDAVMGETKDGWEPILEDGRSTWPRIVNFKEEK